MAAGEKNVVETEDVEELGENATKIQVFTLEALQVIKEAQQQHGLRHGDFQRYRQYCARRIRRIRKSLHFPQGGKHKVTPKKITLEMLTDSRYLLLPLVDAERAWSYGMQLKSEANTEPRKKFHLVSKYRKAVQHADTFLTLCESDVCDARTKLEAQAYNSWMKGTLQFEQENWKAAIEYFTKAQTIYEKLAGTFVDEVKDIYLQRVEEIVPNIRYCAYNIGDESAMQDLMKIRLKAGREDPLTSRLDELISQTREKQAVTLSEVTWRGRTVPVKNEKVRGFLLSVQESEKQLGDADTADSKVSIYESLLKELIDAQQSLRDELKDDPHFRAAQRGQPTEGRVSNLVYLHTYLMYLRLTKTIDRNLLMVESMKVYLPGAEGSEGKKSTKPQDLARLYDIIIQNLSDIPNLPGLEEDSTLSDEVATQTLGYKAFRCFYTAQTYAGVKKWREAIALYERVLHYAREAMEGYKNTKGLLDSKKAISGLESLVKEVEGLKYSCHASSILCTEDVTEKVSKMSVKNNKPLDERLDEYYEAGSLVTKKPNLTQFPPDFQPVPCKPLFFDLALNHVQMPALDDRLEQKKAGGLTGFVRGWLWGSKK